MIVRSSLILLGLVAAGIAVNPRSISAAEIYFGSLDVVNWRASATDAPDSWRAFNNLASSAWLPSAGGGVGTVASTPTTSLQQVHLVDCVIGGAVGTFVGSPASGQSLLEYAAGKDGSPGLIQQGAAYNFIEGQTGLGVGRWNIRFESTVDSANPNFFESKLIDARRYLRAAIRANPFSIGTGNAYARLLDTHTERIIPRTYAGNDWYAKAAEARLKSDLGGTYSVAREEEYLVNAVSQYKRAAEIFYEVTGHPVESHYLGVSAPFGAWSGTTEGSLPNSASRLFAAHANALSLLVESEWSLFRFRYFQRYRDPLTTGFDSKSLSDEILARVLVLERQLLLASVFSHIPGFVEVDLRKISLGIQSLREMADAIQRQELFFAAGRDPGNITRFRAYSPAHVPFLLNQFAFSKPFSVDNIMDYASELVGNSSLGTGALQREAEGLQALQDLVQSDYDIISRAQQIRTSYESQLAELCGAVRDNDGNFVPDLTGYLLPPELRTYTLPRPGAIYAQWQRIQAAKTKIQAALQDIKDISSEAEIAEQAGAERVQSEKNVAYIYLQTGEKVAALEKIRGDIQAEAAMEEARIEAEKSKGGLFGKIAGFALRVGAAFVTGGASEATGIGTILGSASVFRAVSSFGKDTGDDPIGSTLGFLSSVQSSHSAAKAAKDIGEVRARSARRLAEINAQETKIRAAESAEVQFERAFQEQSRVQERIRTIFVRLERLKLNKLLAEQDLDAEYTALSNLIGQVGQLLQDYRSALLMERKDPRTSPDFRLIRDHKVRLAEESFYYAQEWCYLAAKASQYRYMRQEQFEEAGGFITKVLRVRNAKGLADVLAGDQGGLQGLRNRFYGAQGQFAPVRNMVISLRDFVVQHNIPIRDSFGEFGAISPGDLQVFPSGGLSDAGQISDEAWLAFLRKNLSMNGQVLTIPFPLSYEPTGDVDNPLLQNNGASQWGHFIVTGQRAPGVFLNIRGRNITGFSNLSVSAQLRQEGTSYVPFKAISRRTASELGMRLWTLPSRSASLDVYMNLGRNQLTDGSIVGSGELNERSPANDRWVLIIDGVFDATNRRFLRDQLANIKDIEIVMSVQGFTEN